MRLVCLVAFWPGVCVGCLGESGPTRMGERLLSQSRIIVPEDS